MCVYNNKVYVNFSNKKIRTKRGWVKVESTQKYCYKIYKGNPKELIYMTFDTDNAARKYFMHINENAAIEIWDGQLYINNYSQRKFELKVIRHDLEDIVNV